MDRPSRRSCKITTRHPTGRCGWHRPKPPPAPEPKIAHIADEQDRRHLGPLLTRLAAWSAEYDAIGEEAGEPLTTAVDFVDWLRLELAFPRPCARA